MITLKRLKLQGFFGIVEAEIPLENQGLVLIAGGNGAGKTALVIESLLYALYGQSFEYGKAPGDGVVNHRMGYCLVELDFSIGNIEYTIRRSRNHPEHKTRFTLLIDGVDKSLGSSAATQAILELALGGMDVEAFKSSVVFSTELVRFPSFPDAAKKAVIENLLGIKESDAALEKAKIGRNTAIQSEAAITQEIASLSATIRQHEGTIRALTSSEVFTAADSERLAALPSMVDAATRAVDEATASDAVEDDPDIPRLMAAIDQAAADADKFKEQWNAARVAKITNMGPLDSELAECTLKLKTCRSRLLTLQKELREVACPACHRVWDDQHKLTLRAEVERLENGSAILEDAIKEIEADKAKVESDFGCKERAALQSMRAAQSSGETMTKQLHRLETSQAAKAAAAVTAAKQRRAGLTRELRDLQNELADLKGRKARVDGAKEANEAAADRMRAAVDECISQRNALEEKLIAAKRECEKWQTLVECFSPKGARMLVLQSAVPRLNAMARRIAPMLSPGIAVSFEARESEAFAVLVDNANGAKNTYRGNSAGERRKVDLVVLFCLAGLQQHPVNLLSVDEAFEKLAPDAQEDVAVFLKSRLCKNGTGFSTIFMINHTAGAMSQYADQVWIMENGILVNKA